MMAYRFVAARHFTDTGSRGRLRELIVIHDMEYPERPNGAEWCAEFFAAPNAPEASAHYYVDNNSVIQGVREKNVAWAAPGANHNGIQIEHAGYASQSRSGWLDAYSLAELRMSAKLAADICIRNQIPALHLFADQIRRGHVKGFAGHLDVNRVFHKSKHTDPGVGFPWDVYLRMVREEIAALDFRHSKQMGRG